MDQRKRLDVKRLHLVGYQKALDLQEDLVRRVSREESPQTLLLLQHPHVITLGRGASEQHLLADETVRRGFGVELHEAGRGGDVTYHGPGQLVGYPILRLEGDRQDLHRYLRDLEEVLILTLGDFGIRGERVPGLTGVWVRKRRSPQTACLQHLTAARLRSGSEQAIEQSAGAVRLEGERDDPRPIGMECVGEWEKVAAIGVRVSHWVTSHGFALNVSPDLSYFNLIVPCGIGDRGVTSMEKLLGRRLPMEEVEEAVAGYLAAVFRLEREELSHACS